MKKNQGCWFDFSFKWLKKDFPYSYVLIIMAQAGATLNSRGPIPAQKRKYSFSFVFSQTLVRFRGHNVLIPEYNTVELGFCVSAFFSVPTLLTEALPLSEYSDLTSAILCGLPDTGALFLCPFCLPTEVEQPDLRAALLLCRWGGPRGRLCALPQAAVQTCCLRGAGRGYWPLR